MSDQIECPICQTISPASVAECPVCGAHLDRVTQPGKRESGQFVGTPEASPLFDSALGEDDLYVPRLLRFPWWGIVIPVLVGGIGLLVLGLLGGVAVSQILSPRTSNGVPGTPGGATMVATLQGAGQPVMTREPTLFLPTLTPTDTPTATPSPSPTPGPCEQTVGAGDTIISVAVRCGHNDLAVIDAIVELNGLRSAESLQVGQVILVPWPTPTSGPTSASTPVAGVSGGEDQTALAAMASSGDDAAPTPISDVIPTATLQPGVMWYTIQPDDNIIKVAVLFDATVEILSQLNPEVTFSQCDYGMDFGGANCIVQLYQGQRVRVPAPSPTPTLSPTPSGSETPTPTPTATFNAPSLLSPGDRFLFGPDDLVTLRWTSTGLLGAEDAYQVTIIDTTLEQRYTVLTTETLTILPSEWQPSDSSRHMFTWEVAVGPVDGRGGLASVTFSTPSRMFFWDSP